MTQEEAKAVLSRYRPGETDRGDVRTAEALAMVQKDAKLSAWFRKYCEEQPWRQPGYPSDPIQIAANEAAAGERTQKAPNRFIFGLLLFLLAGGFIIGMILLDRPVNRVEDYCDRMSRMVQRGFPMKIEAADQRQAMGYFATNNGVVGWSVPAGMEDFPAQGAAVLTWNDKSVSLMGMRTPSGQVVFLFVASNAAFHDPPFRPGLKVPGKVGGFATRIWRDNKFVYLLTGPDEKLLDSLMK